MNDDNRYNGWANHETWCVNMWLRNDEGLYNAVKEMADSIWSDRELDETKVNQKAAARYEMESPLRDFIEEVAEMTCPGVIEGGGFVSDLFRSALGSVDWLEIAESWIDDAEERAE